MSLLSIGAQERLKWIKASASQGIGMCVQLASYPGGVALRRSASPEDGALIFSRNEFAAFVDGVKRGEFDYLVDLPAQRGASRES